MEYGKIKTRGYDKQGRLTEIERNIFRGEVASPIFRTIEDRVRVSNAKEELDEYKKFSKLIHADSTIIHPAFKIETSYKGLQEGFYYVVKKYTKLERFKKA